MNIVYETIHGSTCYGLNGPNSDLDIRGVFLPTREHVLGLSTGPETVQPPKDDTVYWEIRKFVNMCLKANPNALEVLFTENRFQNIIEDPFRPILDNRKLFLTKRCEATFGGYAKQQLYRLRNRKGQMASDAVLRKDAMHLVRLLLFGQQILDTGNLKTFFAKEDPNTNFLTCIKAGVVPEDEVLAWAENAFEVMKTKGSDLPDEPEPETVHAFNKMVMDAVQSGIEV